MRDARTNAALRHIRDLLGRFADREVRYTPNSCLTEQDGRAWEELHKVALPEQYRFFLQEIGDGGTMPGSYCDFVVEPLAKVQGRRTAATPFPVTAARLRKRFRQLKKEGHPADGVLFPELEPFWEEHERPPGCLVFGQYPSADALFLVTAGDLRGSVWCGVCAGIPETDNSDRPAEFLTWFADALTELTDE